jgi:hypothetical protein
VLAHHLPEIEIAERRPETNKGGREEEENRPRISTELTALGRPLSIKQRKCLKPATVIVASVALSTELHIALYIPVT